MEADWAKWVGRNRALKNADEEIDFQTDYVLDIARCKWQWMWWWWLVNIALKVKLQEPRSFLKVSYNVPFSIMTQIKRDCGSDFPWDLDVGDMFKVLLLSPWPDQSCINFLCQEWHHHKDEDILTYRDKSFASKFTGAPLTIPFYLQALGPSPSHCLVVRLVLFLCLFANWHFSICRHPVPCPSHQLHVRPRRLPWHLHAPDKEVKHATVQRKKIFGNNSIPDQAWTLENENCMTTWSRKTYRRTAYSA